MQQFRARKSRERASQAIYDAVRLRIEGRFGQALKQATAAYEANESPGLAALLAARAAESLRDDARYRYWLGKAAEHDGETRVARLMTEAKLAVEGRRFDEASERTASPQSPVAWAVRRARRRAAMWRSQFRILGHRYQ